MIRHIITFDDTILNSDRRDINWLESLGPEVISLHSEARGIVKVSSLQQSRSDAPKADGKVETDGLR
jgi:hypothetical protein